MIKSSIYHPGKLGQPRIFSFRFTLSAIMHEVVGHMERKGNNRCFMFTLPGDEVQWQTVENTRIRAFITFVILFIIGKSLATADEVITLLMMSKFRNSSSIAKPQLCKNNLISKSWGQQYFPGSLSVPFDKNEPLNSSTFPNRLSVPVPPGSLVLCEVGSGETQ